MFRQSFAFIKGDLEKLHNVQSVLPDGAKNMHIDLDIHFSTFRFYTDAPLNGDNQSLLFTTLNPHGAAFNCEM
jgi:hypothetical protein